jgi:hypothetical protein
MRTRDPEAEWLPHCLFCDARHNPQKQTCADWRKQRDAREKILPATTEYGSDENVRHGDTPPKHHAA